MERALAKFDWLSDLSVDELETVVCLMPADQVALLRKALSRTQAAYGQDISTLRSALETIANPSTVAGMHYQDRDQKLQKIARDALATEGLE